MNKHGFTLVELLVVIAIIAILSIIIVPSVMNVNSNVNKRMLNQKIENIESGAVLFASRNDDIFNGTDEVEIKVYELIQFGYITVDVNIDDSRCQGEETHNTKGCILDPTAGSSDAKTLNNYSVILRKKGVGYTAELVYTGGSGSNNTTFDGSLVDAVCTAFAEGKFVGKSSTENTCYCYTSLSSTTPAKTSATVLKDSTGAEVDACIIAGENPNNYLRYGDSKPNWRVLGVYKLEENGETILSAKIITSEPI